jgi:hypothetical protein
LVSALVPLSGEKRNYLSEIHYFRYRPKGNLEFSVDLAKSLLILT